MSRVKKPPFGVLYEDNHLLVVNKPAGMLSQADRTGDESLVDHATEYIREKYDKPGRVFCGLPHRLDRPVSGAVALARTSKALERLAKAFQDRAVEKVYWAAVKSRPPADEQTLLHWIKKNESQNRSFAYEQEVKGSKLAQLSYKLEGRVGPYYLLEVRPKTGRPHQIRAQLALIGCPIKGDVKYGYPKPNAGGTAICLHARVLSFEHPVRKEAVRFVAALPKHQSWDGFWEEDEARKG